MHVIARPAIHAAIRRHRDAEQWLTAWWGRANGVRWTSLEEVRVDYPSVDQVGCCLVFNVKGNTYRLICRVTYASRHTRGTLLVKAFLTHAEYDRGDWKKDCT